MPMELSDAANTSRFGRARTTLTRLWNPNTPPEDLGFHRAWLLVLGFNLLAWPVLPILLIVWLVWHVSLGTFGVLLAATAVAFGSAMNYGLQLWRLFRRGRLKGFEGKLFLRAEQPVQFWSWASAHIVCCALTVAAAGFLFWQTVLSA